jgi:hypothetical protein
MRTRLQASLAALAALFLLPALGCNPVHSDVQLKWTFAGATCQDVGISKIRVTVDGEQLVPDTFDCLSGGKVTTGVDLGRFLTGLYDITLEGLDSDGRSVLWVTKTVHVGNAPVNVFTLDLGIGSVVLDWTFDGLSCAQADVSYVRVSLDGQELTDDRGDPFIPCTQDGFDGVVIGPVDAGPHSIDLVAYQGNAVNWTLSGLPVDVALGYPAYLSAELVSAAGNAAAASISWTFAGLSCAQAQATSVQVLVDGVDAGTVPCSTGGVDGAVVSPLSPGGHSFQLLASRTVGTQKQLVYESVQTSPLNFRAGYTLAVVLDAPATSPGRGGALLRWKFPAGGPDCASASGAGTPIAFTLKDHTGTALASLTATCGGANGSTGVTFCNPAAGGCAGSDTGLPAGAWTLDAVAQGPVSYGAHLAFGVPNAASGTYDVTFVAK